MLTDSDLMGLMLWTPSGGGVVADTGCRIHDSVMGDYEVWAFKASARGPSRYALFLRRGPMLHSMDRAYAHRGSCDAWPFNEGFLNLHASFMSRRKVCDYIRAN